MIARFLAFLPPAPRRGGPGRGVGPGGRGRGAPPGEARGVAGRELTPPTLDRPPHVIDQARRGAPQTGPGAPEPQRPIGAGAPDPDRGEQSGIPPSHARQIGGVDPIGLVLVVIEPAQLPAVGHKDLVPLGGQFAADPPGVRAGFHNDSARRGPGEARAQRRAGGRDAPLLHYRAIRIHGADLAPAVAHIEANRYVHHRANLRADGLTARGLLPEDPPTRIPRPRKVGLLISIFSRARPASCELPCQSSLTPRITLPGSSRSLAAPPRTAPCGRGSPAPGRPSRA